MALIVTMKAGHQVKVGDKLYTVAQVTGPESFAVVEESAQAVFFITSKEWVKVEPSVKFMAGIQNKEHGAWVKLLIQAPSEIAISEIKRG